MTSAVEYKLLAHRRVLNNDPEYTLAPGNVNLNVGSLFWF